MTIETLEKAKDLEARIRGLKSFQCRLEGVLTEENVTQEITTHIGSSLIRTGQLKQPYIDTMVLKIIAEPELKKLSIYVENMVLDLESELLRL